MTYDEFNQFVGACPRRRRLFQWGGAQVMKVGAVKCFCRRLEQRQECLRLRLKTSELNYDFLRNKRGY